MTIHQATRGSDGDRQARCACGLAFPGPWELTGHFLAVYPPHADQPLDDIPHADVTRLAVKLDEGPSEAWEAGTWALDPRRHLRVAASVAMRSAAGDLKPWTQVTQRELAETYHVPAHVARNAIAELTAAGILGHYGGRNTVVARDIIRSHNKGHRTARILDLIALRIADLETEVAALKAEPDPAQAGAHQAPRRIAATTPGMVQDP
jgi:DNA-binding transcriptional regulator YhcF (GntR family)